MQQIEDKTADFNRYYHQAGDTVDHMDAAYWQAMMRGLVATIATWAGPVPAAATPAPTSQPTVSPAPTGTVTPTPPSKPTHTPAPTRQATIPAAVQPIRLPICYRPTR